MTTYRWSFEEDVTAYRSQGIEGIGVWRQKLSEFGEERGADLLRESGLTVTSLSSAGGFTGSDGGSFDDAVADALDAVRVAGEIQAACLVVISGARAGHTKNYARRLLRDALVELGDAAAEENVQVAIQPMRTPFSAKWSFLNSIDATLDVLHRCNHAHVGMAFDVYQFGREAGICRRLKEIAPWLRTVAVSDAREFPRTEYDRCLPCEGTIPLVDIVQALEAAGYTGFYDLQILSEEYWSSDYQQLLHSCQEAFRSICPSPVSS